MLISAAPPRVAAALAVAQAATPADAPSAAVPTRAEEETAALCVVCDERAREFALVPCGHLCLCASCRPLVLGASAPTCPLCRADCESALRVYT